MSAAATKAFEQALADAGGGSLRLQTEAQFQNELFFGPRGAGDIEVRVSRLTLLLDRSSARRADGTSIDFVEGPDSGFEINNPNEPSRVKQLTPPELKAMLDRGEVILFDVRPENERAIAIIAGARALDAAGQPSLFGLDRSPPIALHCHHGIRSQGAAQHLLREGFRNVYNLKGGIDAWSQSIDPSMRRY